MRKFVLLIIKTAFSFCLMFIFYFYSSTNIIKGFDLPNHVNFVQNLAVSSEIEECDTIVIGDSVGKNIHEKQEGWIYNRKANLTCVAGVSILGHLLLLERAILNNKNKDNIIVDGYFKPSSLLTSLNEKWSNGDFIKRFYNRDWLFNEKLCAQKTSFEIDSIFLKEYKPISILVKNTWLNSRSIFTYNSFGNNKNSEQSKLLAELTLIDYLYNSEFLNLLRIINFKSMPIHPDKFSKEMQNFEKLKKLGLNIKPPIKVSKEYFLDDKIHLKKQFRSYEFYKLMLDKPY